MSPYHDGPVVKRKRNVKAQPTPQAERHPDCQFCEASDRHLNRQVVAGGRLRLEVMDYKIEAKRYRKELLEHTNLGWVRELLGIARCSHGISLQGRCSRCGAIKDERREYT